MIKKWTFILIFLIPNFVFGGHYSEKIPKNCFSNNIYCSTSKVIKKMIDGKRRKVASIEIFLSLNAEEYVSEKEILDLFYDFDNWDSYVEEEGSGDLMFYKTVKLSSIYENGKEIRRQYLHYDIKAPMPVRRMTIRAVGHYFEVNPMDGAIKSIVFKHLTKGRHEIPGGDILIGCQGFKHTAGFFHIYHDKAKNNFLVIFSADVIPDASFFLSVAASYIENGFLSIMRGMFGI